MPRQPRQSTTEIVALLLAYPCLDFQKCFGKFEQREAFQTEQQERKHIEKQHPTFGSQIYI